LQGEALALHPVLLTRDNLGSGRIEPVLTSTDSMFYVIAGIAEM